MTLTARAPGPLILCFALLLGCNTEPTTTAPLELESSTSPSSDPQPAVTAHDFVPAPANDDRSDGLFAYTSPGELPKLLIAGDEQGATLPLEHTDVAAQVRGHVARVIVNQRFANDRSEAIEVTYTFPLPENAAVDDMRMVIGERVIHSEVQTRARARATYDEARAAGHTAALLEQERPNIFTQSVANIAPGEAIEVEIAYLQTLSQDAGVQEFVFPMVVGPRFIPGTPTGVSGDGTKPDTDVVPDASRITPPIVGEGQRSGNDVSLTLDVDAGLSIDSWDAPTHTVTGAATAQGFSARLADAETIPNRDFVIRWQVAAAQARATLFLGPPPSGTTEGHFALLIQPPQLDVDELVGRREMIFVIDRSGSMSGVPLALAKQTLRQSLQRLRPVDTFDVVGFESGTERLFGRPRPANEHNLVLAERFIDGMSAGGGTMMADAVEAALAPRLGEGARRYVFFLTDGYIGNEDEIFTAAATLVERAATGGGRARVFGLGIGSSTNRELISGLSRAGDGVPLYVSNREHPAAVINDYYRYVDHPVLEELEIDWAGLDVDELYPSTLPDLFASHALVVHGRYRGSVKGQIELHASVAGQGTEVELPVEISSSTTDERIVSTLWARDKITDLSSATWDGTLTRDQAAAEITALGLEYHLVTAYTSFVAVDDSRVVGDGDPTHVVQPVEVPEDVDPVASGATVYDFEDADLEASYYAPISEDRETRGKHKACKADAWGNCIYKRKPSEPTTPSSAKLKFKKLKVSAGVDADTIEATLERMSADLEQCYLDAPSEPKLEIQVRLHFDANGSLSSVSLSASDLGADLERCFEREFKKQPGWAAKPGAFIEFVLKIRAN